MKMKHLLFDKCVDKSEEVIQNSKITQISDHAFEVVTDKNVTYCVSSDTGM
jgi:hypothetical protein